MGEYPLSDRIELWGVDREPSDSRMLLDFIEDLSVNQPVPTPARTKENLGARRNGLLTRLRRSLGLDPWPEKVPLASRTVGTIERDGYTLEKLVYQSWPGVTVTAHLYLPKRIENPTAGLVYACGHWMEAGKLGPSIQAFCASAATLGIVTLVYDPIGQGERFETWRDHSHLNALLVGASQLGLMVWESIRALDYLLTRDEVDAARIGITGASGGGLNTLFASAVEERFACSIPVAYPCTFAAAMQAERDLNWEDGTDVCNQVPEVMSYAEMSDVASLFLPKPYMILSGSRDKIFPIEGARTIAAEMRHNYELFGVPERFRFMEFDEVHGYQRSLREAAYGWLNRWLLNGESDEPIEEPELALFPDPYPVRYNEPPRPNPHDLRAQSPTMVPVEGALPGFCLSLKPELKIEEAIGALIRNRNHSHGQVRPSTIHPNELPDWQRGVLQQIGALLGPFPENEPLNTRLLNQVWEDGLMVERITFTSERDVVIPGLFMMPADWKRPVPFVIHAAEWGKNQGFRSGVPETLLNAGYGVLSIDVRGVGETATSDFEAATNLLMMNRPLFGQRVYDVIRAIDFLWERCYIAPQIDKGRISIVGEGVGGLWALYAGALDKRVAAVVARGTLYSYGALLNHDARYPASVYLFDVLNHLDIADVVACCAPRPVSISPVDEWRRRCKDEELAAAFETARIAYRCNDASERLLVESVGARETIPHWLNEELEFTSS